MGITPERLLNELLEHHDRGDQAEISRLLARHRNDVVRCRPTRSVRTLPERASIVGVRSRGGEIIVRPCGPTVGEREALIIRTEVNRVLLDRRERLDLVTIDLSALTTVSAATLRLVTDLRRSAAVLGAETIATGIPEELARPIRNMRIDGRRPRRWSVVMRSILP